MKRRKFLAAGALGAGGLLAGCDCSDAARTGPLADGTPARRRELKMVTTWPKDFPGLGTMAERVAQFIAELSGGAMRVRVYAAGELVGAFEAFDAVSSGAADLYHGADYYWVGKSQAYPFFCAAPFGMTVAEVMAWIEFGGGQALWDELAARFRIKPFIGGNTAHQPLGWFKRPINSLADLRGMRVRMPGIGGEVLRRVGASAVALAGGEIYQQLQAGGIDGAEWVGPWNDLAFGFYREAKYYYWPGFQEPSAQITVGLNLGVWEDMTLQEKAIIRAACQQANHLSIAEYAHYNALALEQLVRDHGVEIRQLPDDVRRALAEAAKAVIAEIEAQGDDLVKRIVKSYRDSLRRSMQWSEVSEMNYMRMRSEVFSL